MGLISKIAARPAVRETAGILVDVIADRIKSKRQTPGVTPSTGEKAVMVNETATAIASSPVLVNAINAEPFYKSRVIIGLATAFAGFGLGRVEWATDTENFVLANIPLFLEAVGLLIGAIGRTVSGLKPINWFKPWTLFGIGAKA